MADARRFLATTLLALAVATPALAADATAAPASASETAMARPMPRLAPVTSATLSLSPRSMPAA